MKFTKHIHVLHLLSQIPAPVMGRVNNRMWDSNVAMTQDEAQNAWDHMFTYIRTFSSTTNISTRPRYSIHRCREK